MAPYLKGVIEAFRDDSRIIGWDLFNEPDNPNPAYAADELPNKEEMSLHLLRLAYSWARECSPSQPLTSGVWRGEWVNSGALSQMDQVQVAESDIISFHCYTGPRRLRARIEELLAYGRPLFLTEYLARPFGSTFEAVLPVLKEHRVAGFNWGLVAGKTQTQYGWNSWASPYDGEPEEWFHDVLRPDGAPYRREEAEFLRQITKD
jgi:hypothetical protein